MQCWPDSLTHICATRGSWVNVDNSLFQHIWLWLSSIHYLCYLEGVMTWKHIQHYWPFVRGIHQSLVDSLHKGPVILSFDILSFDVSVSVWVKLHVFAHWRLTKVATILYFFLKEIFCILIEISSKFLPISPTDHKSVRPSPEYISSFWMW